LLPADDRRRDTPTHTRCKPEISTITDMSSHASDLPAHRAVLDEIQSRWNGAASTWDTKGLASIYSEDALFFGLLPRLYVGRAQIEEYFGTYEGTLESVSLTLVEQNTRALAPGVFSAQGFGDIVNRHYDGKIVPRRVRSSFVIAERGGQSEILLHHFSLMEMPAG
jgi:ketosteroid isomerase-like protein